MLREQRPVREEIFAMDAYPGTHFHFVIAIKLTGQFLARCNVKGSLLSGMTRMQMWLLVTLPLPLRGALL